MENPEERRIIVLRRGTWYGLNGFTSFGGQSKPIFKSGERLLWKKAQKKLVKKSTSLTINRIIPNFKPFFTIRVC